MGKRQLEAALVELLEIHAVLDANRTRSRACEAAEMCGAAEAPAQIAGERADVGALGNMEPAGPDHDAIAGLDRDKGSFVNRDGTGRKLDLPALACERIGTHAVYRDGREGGGDLLADAFERCITNVDLSKAILAGRDVARSGGVTDVPAFFINGVPFEGEKTYEAIGPEIDRLLQQ